MSLARLAHGVVASVTIGGESSPRVELSPAAAMLLDRLWAKHGPLMFHQSGGCCDGSAPMCYPAGEFLTGDADVLLGELDLGPDADGPRVAPFWMSAEQFAYWRHTYPPCTRKLAALWCGNADISTGRRVLRIPACRLFAVSARGGWTVVRDGRLQLDGTHD